MGSDKYKSAKDRIEYGETNEGGAEMFLKNWKVAHASVRGMLASVFALAFLSLGLTTQAAAYVDFDYQQNAEKDAECTFELTEDNILKWQVLGDAIGAQLDQFGNVPLIGQRPNPYEGPRMVTLFAIESVEPIEFFTCKIFIPKELSSGGSLSTLQGANAPSVSPEKPPTCEEIGNCPPPECDTDECNPPPQECPPGTSGTYPNCVSDEEGECPPNHTGSPPNCVPPGQQCEEGQVGSPPNCQDPGPPDDHCDNGVGTGEDCSPPGDPPNNDDCDTAEPGSPGCEEEEEEEESCPDGTVGNPPNCQTPGRP